MYVSMRGPTSLLSHSPSLMTAIFSCTDTKLVSITAGPSKTGERERERERHLRDSNIVAVDNDLLRAGVMANLLQQVPVRPQVPARALKTAAVLNIHLQSSQQQMRTVFYKI